MKKITGIFMVVFLILILVGCSKASKLYITGFYNAETREYHIKNVAENIDYEDITVYLKIKNEKGYETNINYDIESLRPDSEYTIDLSDMTEISEVYLYKYTYYESPMYIIGLFILLFSSIAVWIAINK